MTWLAEETCGVNIALAVFGSKWKPTLLWLLADRPRRFAELRREAGPISEKVLAAQLRELQRDGVVSRHERPGFPLHVEYALTDRGALLERALEPVADWGHQNLDHLCAAREQTQAG